MLSRAALSKVRGNCVWASTASCGGTLFPDVWSDGGWDGCPGTVVLIPRFYLSVMFICLPLGHIVLTVVAGFLNWVCRGIDISGKGI